MSIYICKICDREFSTTKKLSSHIVVHNIKTKNYYDLYLKTKGEGKCFYCGESTTYISITKGYRVHCGVICGAKTSSEKQWSLDNPRSLERKEVLKKQFNNRETNPTMGRPKGSKNINSYPKSQKVLERYKKFPPPSWFGKHHTEETKENKSIFMTAHIKKYGFKGSYKGKFTPKNLSKYQGDHRNIFYRSSWECRYMAQLDKEPDVLEWSSEEIRIPYISPKDNKQHTYFPDFFMKTKTKNGIECFIVEIKPYSQTLPPVKKTRVSKKLIEQIVTYSINQAKWEAAKAFCATKNWQFKILTEKELGITY